MAARSGAQALCDAWDGSDVFNAIHVDGYASALPPGCDQIACRESFTVGPCHLDPREQLRQRDLYWQDREESLKPPAGANRRTRRRNALAPEWSPLLSVHGGGKPQKVETAGSLQEALAKYSPLKPVILWTTSHWSDRLQLWWLLDAIGRSDLELSRFNVAEAWSADPEHNSRVPDLDPISCAPARRLRAAFDSRVPLRSRYVARGASLWQKYAAPSPIDFDALRRRGCAVFPELQSSAMAHGAYFPREVSDGTFRLSHLDETFLEGLRGDAWLSPLEILRVAWWTQAILHKSPFGESSSQVNEWLRTKGKELGFDAKVLRRMIEDRVRDGKEDQFVPLFDLLRGETIFSFRLQQWARHQPHDPFIECRPGPNTVNSLMWVSYRLTARGQRLLEEGLRSPDDAPPIFAGGCEVYRPDPFWVREESGRKWRLKRIK